MLSNLYTNQEATIRTEYGETGNIPIGKGVRQGKIGMSIKKNALIFLIIFLSVINIIHNFCSTKIIYEVFIIDYIFKKNNKMY